MSCPLCHRLNQKTPIVYHLWISELKILQAEVGTNLRRIFQREGYRLFISIMLRPTRSQISILPPLVPLLSASFYGANGACALVVLTYVFCNAVHRPPAAPCRASLPPIASLSGYHFIYIITILDMRRFELYDPIYCPTNPVLHIPTRLIPIHSSANATTRCLPRRMLASAPPRPPCYRPP